MNLLGILRAVLRILCAVVRAQSRHQKVAVAQNHGEDVVEIVGNATRQSTERLELLRLPYPLFRVGELLSLRLEQPNHHSQPNHGM